MGTVSMTAVESMRRALPANQRRPLKYAGKTRSSAVFPLPCRTFSQPPRTTMRGSVSAVMVTGSPATSAGSKVNQKKL